MKAKVFTAYRYFKTKFFTASIFFTLAVILFGGLTFIEFPCPICGGTGFITGARDLEVTGIEYELVSHEIVSLECGWDYESYTYDVKLSVKNKTAAPLYGIIQLTFHDPGASTTRYVSEEDEPEIAVEVPGAVIAAENIFVDEIAAGAERTIEETIVFEGVTLAIFGVEIHQVIAHTADEFACPFHGETAKVPLPQWLGLR